MIDCPRYLRAKVVGEDVATVESDAVAEGQCWLKEYRSDVQCLQEYKQHRVHPEKLEN